MSYVINTSAIHDRNRVSAVLDVQAQNAAHSHRQDFHMHKQATLYQDDLVILRWNPGHRQPQVSVCKPMKSFSGGQEVANASSDHRVVFRHSLPSTKTPYFFLPDNVINDDLKWAQAWNRGALWLNSDDDGTFPFYEFRFTTDGQWGYVQCNIVPRS
jgi:hypothetical protein